MPLKLFFTTIAVLFLIACRSGKEEEIFKKFSEEYAGIKNRYEENMSFPGTGEQYKTYRFQKGNECEILLQKYGEQVTGDAAELLKAKLAIEIPRLDDAELKINNLIENKSTLINDAKLVKVQILIYKNKPDEALTLLREIQDKMEPGLELLSTYLYFALYSQDSGIIEEYAGKFLASQAIPRSLNGYKADIFHSLSFAALLKNDREGAVSNLESAISETSNLEKKVKWQSELAELQTIGTPAPPLNAEIWLNSNPIDLGQLKNNVVLMVFWAPWSNFSRQAMPDLVELYGKYKSKGLVIIGLTKLYGKYQDEAGDKGVVNANDEVNYLREFLIRHQVTYPVAIGVEAINNETYKVPGIPTMVFIDKRGKLALKLVGTWQKLFLEKQINRLLEE
jgi:thiol-disulfide isomerase/thioredoxin